LSFQRTAVAIEPVRQRFGFSFWHWNMALSGLFIMDQSKGIADAITTLIKLMVDHPDGVAVESVPASEGSTLRISVDPADIGKVIGKQGRTARSLRVIVTAMGMASKQRISLDIRE
jgi:predicted RNA-binding protein YlqC (UPF0109 family)